MLKHRLEGRDHESVEEEGRSSPFAFPESNIGPQYLQFVHLFNRFTHICQT